MEAGIREDGKNPGSWGLVFVYGACPIHPARADTSGEDRNATTQQLLIKFIRRHFLRRRTRSGTDEIRTPLLKREDACPNEQLKKWEMKNNNLLARVCGS